MWVLYMMFLTFDLSAPAYVEKIGAFYSYDGCTTFRDSHSLQASPDPTNRFKSLPKYAEPFIDADGNKTVTEELLPVRYACVFVHNHRKTLD